MPIYTYSDLKNSANGKSHGKITNLIDPRVTANQAVREVLGRRDLRSMKRKSQLSPNLFDKVYSYGSPANLKDSAIIDIRRQVNRTDKEDWSLTTEEEFDRLKTIENYLFALSDADFIRILKLKGIDSGINSILHDLDSISGDGLWATVGSTDATNLREDNNNFINGSGSLEFDTNSGLTLAAVDNSTMEQKDLTDYLNEGSIFVWVYIPAITNLTNFILRWGSDSGNYWTKTVTVTNENLSFYIGWNLLRFDWATATKVGNPDESAIDYLRFEITKGAGMAAAYNWRLDSIVARMGTIYDVIYYTKYGWQTAAGAYIENSTADTDLLNCDTEEFDLIADHYAELVSQENKDWDDYKILSANYIKKDDEYKKNHPSESKSLITSRYSFEGHTTIDEQNQ